MRGRHSPRFLVACMPKSGSTFLTVTIASLPGLKQRSLIRHGGRREQELDPGKLRKHSRSSYAAQHHVRYNEGTKWAIERFNLLPIVLTRDIFDVCISLKDHFRREGVENPMGYVNVGMTDWEDDRLELYIAQMIIPWYFNFYLTWLDAEWKISVNYTELKNSPGEALERIIREAGLSFTSENVDAAIEKASNGQTRKNASIEGRGISLNQRAREHIFSLAAHYPDVDFSELGIIRKNTTILNAKYRN